MKTKFFIPLVLLFLIACNKGYWLNENAYRPKKAAFKLINQNFQFNSLIDTQFVYVTTNPFVNFDQDSLYSCMYFYSDGRMAIDRFRQKVPAQEFSHDKAFAIGYYKIEGNTLFTALFMPGQGGFYLYRHARLENDDIIFDEKG
jgi:hypothetical protein